MDCPHCSTPITESNRGMVCLDGGEKFCASCELDFRKPRRPGERSYCARCYEARVTAARSAPAEILVVHPSGKTLGYRRGEFLTGDEWGGEALLLQSARAFLPGTRRTARRSGKIGTEAGDVLVERGKHLVAAARYSTSPSKDAHEKLAALVLRFEAAYRGRIEDAESPPGRLEGMDDLLEQVFAPPARARPPPPPPPRLSSPIPDAERGLKRAPPPPPPGAAPEKEAAAKEAAAKGARSEWFTKGLEADRARRYDEAVGHYDRAIAEDSGNVRALFNKGVALQMLERHADALESYDRALVLDPSDAEIWSNKGLALRAMGRMKEAIHCYDSAIELDPDDASVWSNKGVALRIIGDVEGAIDSYDRALKLESEDAGIWSNKAVALQMLGRYDDAMHCLERALEISPGKASAKKNLELLKRQLRRRR